MANYRKHWQSCSTMIARILIVILTIISTHHHVLNADETENNDNRIVSIRNLRTSLRLPNATYPLHYHLHIITHIDRGDLQFNGNVTVDVAIRYTTNEIVMHAKNLSQFEITVQEITSGEFMDDIIYTYDAQAHFLIVHTKSDYQAFEAGQHFRLQILYKGIMQEGTVGIYWFTHTESAESGKTVYLAATQFEPTGGRLAFPCYDEPAFKANFTIRLTYTRMYTAISNMPVDYYFEHSDEANNSMVTTTFQTTPKMSTYLVAFVISNFEKISTEYRGITQSIYTSPSIADKGHKPLQNAVRTVAALEDYFGIPYSLSKLDHVALPKNYGAAMENWGLITYKEEALVFQNDADVHGRLKDTLTQTHEIVHQWIGDLVSPEWWTYAWLNEGFATYFGFTITDILHPEYKTMDYFLLDPAERAINFGYISVRPMSYYVEEEAAIMSVFDIVSYQRAACVIKMFDHAFGQDTLKRIVHEYLIKFQYSVANEMQLFEVMQQIVFEDFPEARRSFAKDWIHSIPEIMLSWTHSLHMPIVTIERNYADDTITIRQKSKDNNSDELWWIPLNFATASEPNFNNTLVDYFMPPVTEVVLTPKDLGLRFSNDDWIVVNKQQTGFYHVVYDDRNLLMIIKALQRNCSTINTLNRIALFQDICPLLENNQIESIDLIFELFKYLHDETELLPWNFVGDLFNIIESNLYGTGSYELFHQFTRQFVTPIYRQLFERNGHHHGHGNVTDTELKARQSVLTIACRVDLPQCLSDSRNVTRNYVYHITENSTINADYYGTQSTILCNALKHLTDTEFNVILDLLAHADRDGPWYDDLIVAACCTQSSAHLNQYLYELLGENSTHSIIASKDSQSYAYYCYNVNPALRPVMWRFFEMNYKYLSTLPYFIENFNRLAEYVPSQYHDNFLKLRSNIARELQNAGNDGTLNELIAEDSSVIGKKVKQREQFAIKYESQIHKWLTRELMPETYKSAFSSSSSATHLRNPFAALRRNINSFL